VRPTPGPSDHQLLARYRATYGIDDAVQLSAEQAKSHLELELRLTQELLASSPATRWETFERCYNELYEALPWLKQSGGGEDHDRWQALLGAAPKRIYEVGSGTAKLALALARNGHYVEATDISRERGGARPETENLTWSVTDGVHLDDFASAAPYDAVISDQVVEHLHPDDILEHFRSAREILSPEGRYIVRTPQGLTGPHDMSPIFGYDEVVGMHLREYSNTELRLILRDAGYRKVAAVFRSPDRPPWLHGRTRASTVQLVYLRAAENLLCKLGRARARKLTPYLRGPLQPGVWLVATR
jgi:SAM-dependent methyltransferase